MNCSTNDVHLRPRHFLNLLAKPLLEDARGCLRSVVADTVDEAGPDMPKEDVVARMTPARPNARPKLIQIILSQVVGYMRRILTCHNCMHKAAVFMPCIMDDFNG